MWSILLPKSQEERSEYGLKDFESDAAAVKDSSSFSWEENRYDHKPYSMALA